LGISPGDRTKKLIEGYTANYTDFNKTTANILTTPSSKQKLQNCVLHFLLQKAFAVSQYNINILKRIFGISAMVG
jgi:hypothetical protein